MACVQDITTVNLSMTRLLSKHSVSSNPHTPLTSIESAVMLAKQVGQLNDRSSNSDSLHQEDNSFSNCSAMINSLQNARITAYGRMTY
jgi:hypothetical protein